MKTGPLIAVSGTGPIALDGSTYAPGDAYALAYRCFEIGVEALAAVGSVTQDVFRNRMYLTNSSD